MEDAGLHTAEKEVREAITDLSGKPIADITGAVQHALACLECVARKTTDTPKLTLGELIKNVSAHSPNAAGHGR